MDNIQNILKSEIGINLISILLGIGLAALLQKKCNSSNCIIINTPPEFNPNNKERINDKCYNFEKVIQA